MGHVVIDPVGRIEGHLAIEVMVDGGEVKEAKASAPMYRGFEQMLVGRHPMDAQRMAQRVCGVCPVIHGTGAALALDAAFGIAADIPANGRIVRNLILGSNYLQSHILHFYTLAALDYVDCAQLADYDGDDPTLKTLKSFIARGELAPFVPRYEGDYRLPKAANARAVRNYARALDIRRICHEMLATFGGKMPHDVAIVPGGVCEQVTVDKILSYRARLMQVKEFIEEAYLPDVIAVAQAYGDHAEQGQGCGRYLSYGVFDQCVCETDLMKRPRLFQSGTFDGQVGEVDASQIAEEVAHSFFADPGGPKHPSEEQTEPELDKQGAYSFAKSPRLNGKPYEVGPLARFLVNYAQGHAGVQALTDDCLKTLGVGVGALQSTLGRHAARALEAKLVAEALMGWVMELKPGEPVCVPSAVPECGQGAGLADGPRGALGHWISIKDHVIERYQLVVPTTWNVSPQDAAGQPGPIEQALIGTKVRDEANPFEIVRIVRSFDPCLACAVHMVTPKGRELGTHRIV